MEWIKHAIIDYIRNNRGKGIYLFVEYLSGLLKGFDDEAEKNRILYGILFYLMKEDEAAIQPEKETQEVTLEPDKETRGVTQEVNGDFDRF